ncbi:unnamed protein product [Plutella xylostella]|uniref:(diamondback moth) hypothetical protein n=1 Tax=Plutella xylostella TaxID=51655 RepID=A0A8S4D3E9_PLUXY|nr:unnamed protein product [Plutella xylostella]
MRSYSRSRAANWNGEHALNRSQNGSSLRLRIYEPDGVNSVRIISMRVPEVIQYGTDAVTLDCEYAADNVTGLVVQWFLADRARPVYQWIPPQRPQALGLLKNKVRLCLVQRRHCIVLRVTYKGHSTQKLGKGS